MRYPAVPPAIALVGGAALGVPGGADQGAVSAALVLGVTLSVLGWRERVAPAFVPAALFTAAVCGYALAATASHRATHSRLRAALIATCGPGAVSDAPGDPVTLIGALAADASLGDAGVRLALDVRKFVLDGRVREASGGVMLTVAGEADPARIEAWQRGRVVCLPAQLRRPSRYLDPGARDDERALALRGTTLVGSVKSGMLVQVLEPGGSVAEWTGALRRHIRHVVDRRIGPHSARSAAIVRAILLGDRAGLDEATEERLQQAGTYHVIAISGGNIAVLAAALMLLATAAGLRPGLAHLVVAAMVVAYAVMVGGGASVVRAAQMAALYLVAHAADHRATPYNAIGASAALTCAADPLSVCDAGAWLTYGATIAILAGTPLLLARVRLSGIVLKAPASLFAASISAELALFPVSALVFSRVTAAGLLLNFAAIPLMSLVQGGGMLLVAVHALAPAGAPAVAWLTHLAAWGLVESARLVEVMPWAVARVPAPHRFVMAVYYASWILWFAVRSAPVVRPIERRASVWARAALASALLASGAWMILTPHLRLRGTVFLEATFIDVGQGAATLVRFPSGEAVLVDAGGGGGGRFEVGRRVVEPAVWAAGVHRVTHLVATHGDADHIGAAASVVSDFRPREVWEGVPVPPDPLLRQLGTAARSAASAWRTVQRGDRIRFGEAEVLALHPPSPGWERQRVRNDDSVVVEVRYGAVSLLLAGDVEASAESEIAPSIEPAGVRVILAPHHGSSTSSTRALVEAAAPDLAVISAGRGNRYGHPHAAALARYRAIGARIVRTDLDGAVWLRTDGCVVEVSTFTGRRLTLVAGRKAPCAPPP